MTSTNIAHSFSIQRTRQGNGPVLLLFNTYRYHGHHVGDINSTYYRSKEEEQVWKQERDPIRIMKNWLLEGGYCDQKTIEQIDSEAELEIKKGVEFGIQAPYPDISEVDQHVYA